MGKGSTITVDPGDHQRLRLAAFWRNKRLNVITHEVIEAGLRVVAPEVLAAEGNGFGHFILDEFAERYVREEEALSEPVLL